MVRSAPGRPFVEGLRGVGLSLRSGGLAVVLGRSGAGKTTLLEALAGLLPLAGGSLRLEAGGGRWSWGPGSTAPSEARRRIGLLFQFPERQLFGATALEDVAWGLGAGGGGRAEKALGRAGLAEDLWGVPLRRLSRGEKRRVALAGLFAREPDLLLLDEPGVGLDPAGQELLWGEVQQYRRQRGAAVVVATHWAESFLPGADEVLVLENGATLYAGPPGELPGAAASNDGVAGLLPFPLRLRAALERGEAPPGGKRWVAAAKLWLEGEERRGASSSVR